MITEDIKNIKSGRSDLRKFGLTMAIVLAILAGLSWWRGKDYYFYFIGLTTAFIFLALVIPSLLKPVHKGWMSLAILMSWLMTRVILSLLFYLGITPIGFLARLFDKDFLELKFNENSSNSYWIPIEKLKREKTDYERQF